MHLSNRAFARSIGTDLESSASSQSLIQAAWRRGAASSADTPATFAEGHDALFFDLHLALVGAGDHASLVIRRHADSAAASASAAAAWRSAPRRALATATGSSCTRRTRAGIATTGTGATGARSGTTWHTTDSGARTCPRARHTGGAPTRGSR